MSTLEERSRDEFFDGRWIREATRSEVFFEKNHLKCNFLLCYELKLKSKWPIEEEHVRLALNHLYRKCPSLQFCYGVRDGTTWIRRATNPEVDFKVLQGQRVKEVKERLHTYRYNSTSGPLFCARLLQQSPDLVDDSDDLEPHLRYSSYMLFGFHHSVGDGTTNTNIMGYFISLLNDVISNKAICNGESLGTFALDDETQTEILKRINQLEANANLKDEVAKEIESFESHSPFMIKGFPMPNVERKSHNLDRILDQSTTAKFFEKCREKKITVNSGFAAVLNVSLMDLLIEDDIIHDSYIMQNYHLLDLRRYWKIKMPKALGLYIGFSIITTEVPKILDQFWEYARSLHQLISEDIKSDKPLLRQAFQILSGDDKTDPTKPFVADFSLSNMGDVTPLVSEGGEHVKITHLIRSTTLHLLNKSPMTIACHTFRGRLTMTFNYNTAAIKREVIEKFCEKIVIRIQGLCE